MTAAFDLSTPRLGEAFNRLEPFAALVVAALAVGLILNGAGELPPAPMDQAFANVDLHISHDFGHWEFHYPVLSHAGGITASLIVGAYKLLVPIDPAHLNHHVKILACLFFLATSRWLAHATLDRGIDRIAVVCLAASSGLSYLEPSSEALAGGAANLFVGLWSRYGRGWLAGVALAVFALLKIELLAVAGAMLVCGLLSEQTPPGRRIGLALGFTAGVSILMAPDIYLYGWRGALLGRELDAFGAHYCALFRGQFSDACLSQEFPRAGGLADILRLYPDRYVAFLGLSVARGLWETLTTLNVSILGIVYAIQLGARKDAPWRLGAYATQLLVCLITTLIVATLFAVVHPRYLTRVYGLTAVFVVAASRALSEKPGFRAMRAWPMLALAVNLATLPQYIAAPHSY